MVVSVLFCYPVLSGKVMNQNDELTAKALNREAEEYNKKTGEFIGWSNTMFSGMPTSVGYTGPSNYSISLIYAFANTFNGFSFDVIFWCLIGMYILFCALGITPWLGALGSFIFAFSTFNILSLEGGHVQKTFNFAMVPLLMGGVYLIFQKRYVWGFIAAAFGVNYQVGLSHYQVTYYAAIAAVAMAIFYGIQWLIKKEYKGLGLAVGLLLMACVFGALPNLTLLNSYYASFETTRGGASELTPKKTPDAPTEETVNKDGLDYGYATQWSYGLAETFTLLVPNASGGDGQNVAYEFDKRGNPVEKKNSATLDALKQNVVNDTDNTYGRLANDAKGYWGDQPFVGGPIYFGAIVCFLFVFGLIASKRNEKWWILAIIILFMCLAWGRHSYVYDFFFHYVKMFNKFRTPSMALGIVQIGTGLMAILGLMALVQETDKKRLQKLLIYTGAGFGVLLLLMRVMPGTLFSFVSAEDTRRYGDNFAWFLDGLAEDRATMMKNDAIRSLVFIGLAFAIGWFYIKGTIKKANYVLIGIAALIVVDLWDVNTRYLNKDKFVNRKQFKYNPTPADNQIKQDAQQKGLNHYRVYNTTVNPTTDAQTSQFHESVGGYHGAKLRKYQELIENQIYAMNPAVLSMLNTHYMIGQGQNGNVPQNPIKNPMGHAWFVQEIKVVENGDQEMEALIVDSSHYFDPARTLVVQDTNMPANMKNFSARIDPAATIQLTKYAPHKLKYEFNSTVDQAVVFSEIFYQQKDGDGWKAFIDGNPADHFRANYVLRAMLVPAGKHTIEFKYDADKALGRVKLGFVFFVLLLAISIGAVYLDWKKKKKAEKAVIA